MSDVLQGWSRDPLGRHEERWISKGRPTSLVRNGGIESRELTGTNGLTGPEAPTGAASPGEVDALPASGPAVWLSSHSGWRKWSRWNDRTPLRAVYQEGARERRRLVGRLLDSGEEVLSDGPGYRASGPALRESDQPSGHLLVTTKRLIFVTEEDSAITVLYSQLRSVDFVKQKSGWRAVELSTDAGESWAVVVLPRTARDVRRLVKNVRPAALR